jgi:hypothetical protein
MSQFWACRTPQNVAALQSDIMRETVQNAVDSSRRMVNIMSLKVDDAAKRIAQKYGPPCRLARFAWRGRLRILESCHSYG